MKFRTSLYCIGVWKHQQLFEIATRRIGKINPKNEITFGQASPSKEFCHFTGKKLTSKSFLLYFTIKQSL
jgi:hypothetical protein